MIVHDSVHTPSCSGTQVHLTGFCTKNSSTGAASLCLTTPPHLWIIPLGTSYNDLKCVTTELPRCKRISREY